MHDVMIVNSQSPMTLWPGVRAALITEWSLSLAMPQPLCHDGTATVTLTFGANVMVPLCSFLQWRAGL